MTALHYAIINEMTEMVNILLANSSVDLNQKIEI